MTLIILCFYYDDDTQIVVRETEHITMLLDCVPGT